MDLDFNACLTLLFIAFTMALITVRCLLAVVNRGFLLVDYAKAQLYGSDSKSGSFGMKDLVGGIAQAVMPALKQKAMEFVGVKPK